MLSLDKAGVGINEVGELITDQSKLSFYLNRSNIRLAQFLACQSLVLFTLYVTIS